MKKFNFNINNFYSIFNLMGDGNKNMDHILDEKIRNSLTAGTSPEFTFELMKRVELEKEFAMQDQKTDKLVKYLIGGVITLMIAVTLVISLVLKTGKEGNELSYFSSIIQKFSGIVEYMSVMAAENLGIAFDYKSGIVVLLAMACIFIFTFADKIIFKKT
ncbi:MAG: hypothetical protein JST15_08985 [Bacteroidetes bacterium]|nr:hypothetical protein [Bacteroidota bacterium]